LEVTNETSGLNVEQRKRLTIGVELAAKPELLLFLDEPTSGLDSQTSWAICDLMEKLTKNGQAVLCTVSCLEAHTAAKLIVNRSTNLQPCYSNASTDFFSSPKVAELSILVKSEKMLQY
jgi:energy-coupling factor transporter ATP-binding protein EcfA2